MNNVLDMDFRNSLQPDDPRRNPELYKLVFEARAKVFQEEFVPFDPIKRPAAMVRQRLNEVRMQVIADYDAAQATQSDSETPKS